MLQKHAGVVALGLMIGGFLGHVLYGVLYPAPTTMALAYTIPQQQSPGIAFNANPDPDCRSATWPDIPKKCLARAGG